jgi:hypothetical protein
LPDGTPLGGESGRVQIDLLQVSAKKIFDLATRKGQDRWSLSHGTVRLIEDVVRTQEVLIKGTIPQRAIEQL